MSAGLAATSDDKEIFFFFYLLSPHRRKKVDSIQDSGWFREITKVTETAEQKRDWWQFESVKWTQFDLECNKIIPHKNLFYCVSAQEAEEACLTNIF